jgi:hypothetical protein
VEQELVMVTEEMQSADVLYEPSRARQRSLGGAILLAAIDDYRSLDHEVHNDAQQFLYPQAVAWRDHFDWVVSVADGVNPAWLRDALDRCRGRWDAQRLTQKASHGRGVRVHAERGRHEDR